MTLCSEYILQKTLNIAQEAGQFLCDFYQRSVKIEIKSDNTPVTEADLFVSQFLIQQLQQLTPNIPILSEENCQIPLQQRSQWQTYWLIDPLDGTQQFINHTDQFSILITLMQNHRAVLGVIYAPILQCTYYAMQGYGAYKQTQNKLLRLSPRNIDLNVPIKVVVGTNTAEQKLKAILNPNFQYQFQTYGSSGLKSALIAEGLADCYIRIGKTSEWDTAVAEILLAETQGIICDHQGKPLTYNQRDTFTNPDFIMWGDQQNIVPFLIKPTEAHLA